MSGGGAVTNAELNVIFFQITQVRSSFHMPRNVKRFFSKKACLQ